MLTEDREAQKVQRRATAVVVGVVMLLLLVVAVVVLFVVRGGGSGESSTAQPVVPGQSPAGPAPPDQASPAPSDEKLTSDAVTWTEFHGIPLPTSPAGPRMTDGGRSSGFDRSPAGAVLAAVHITFRASSQMGPAVFEPTVASQIVGSDKATFLATIQHDYESSKARYGMAVDGSIAQELARAVAEETQVWAYRTDAYDPSVASVHLLIRTTPTGSTEQKYVDFALTVRWVDGDWRVVAPLNGEFQSAATAARTVPADYVLVGHP